MKKIYLISYFVFITLTFSQSLETKVDLFLQPYLDRKDFSGSVLVVKNGEVLLSKGYGFADYSFNIPNKPSTKFRIGSVTKQFTAAAILILEQDGKIKTSGKLSDYVTEFPNGNKITIHHLLTHSARLERDLFTDWDYKRKYRPLSVLVELIKKRPLAFHPGEKMSYSNCGYIVLAFLIEKLSGESYQEFIKSKIFEPLEMKNSGVFENQILVENLAHGYDPGFGEQKLMISPREDLSNSTGAGGIYSTVEDLYKWDRSLYKNIILVDSSIHKMTRNYGDGRGYGFGIYTRFGRKAAGHDGISNGYTAFIDRYYEDDAGVIYAGNIRSGALSIIQNGLSAILFDQEYDNYIPPELDYDFAHKDNDLNKFAGKYELFPGFNLKVIRIREHLFLSGTAGYFTYLHPIGPKSFYYRSMYAKIKFEENENSMVTKMIWMDNKNREYPAIKLK